MKGMKGISLPIEMIVVIAIAVLVLVVIAAFFVGGAGKIGGATGDAEAFADGCNQLSLQGCSPTIDLDAISITGYSEPQKKLTGLTTRTGGLFRACVNMGRVYSIVQTDAITQCRRACGCPA